MTLLSRPLRTSYHCDGVVRSADKIADLGFLERLVWKVAAVSNMRVINMAVSCIKEDLQRLDLQEFEDEGGYSILCLISTSHIALHVWPNRGAFMFDLVSCRPFNSEVVDRLIRQELDVVLVDYLESYCGCKDDSHDGMACGGINQPAWDISRPS